MRTKLTLLAVLASASFFANAQSTPVTANANNVQSIPAGNEPTSLKAPGTASDTTRAAVRSNASDAVSTGTIATGNKPTGPMVSPHSDTTRAIQRGEGAAAIQSGTLATGNEPIPGVANKKAQKEMHKKAAKTSKTHSAQASSVKSGNAPYANKQRPASTETRSEVKADTAMSGGVSAIKSGNEPLTQSPTTASAKTRDDVKANAAAAVKSDSIRTGDGAAMAPKR